MGVICDVTPIGLLHGSWVVLFLHGGYSFFSQSLFLSLTEHTDVTELFHQRFEPTERLRHTEVTEAFQLTLAVTLCVIG